MIKHYTNEIFNTRLSIEIKTVENRNIEVELNTNDIEFRADDEVNI